MQRPSFLMVLDAMAKKEFKGSSLITFFWEQKSSSSRNSFLVHTSLIPSLKVTYKTKIIKAEH